MLDAQKLIRPRRAITGISAILLPYEPSGDVDWTGFDQHVQRTVQAGLQPAVNMDTGYGHLIEDNVREHVLERTQSIAGDEQFVAGAFVGGVQGSPFDRDSYARQIELIRRYSGTPVIFQSFGLTEQSNANIIDSYRAMGTYCDRFIAFELGEVFAPFGKIYSLDVYRGLLEVSQCIGAKHSSLRRDLEWQRLAIRDQQRPEFKVFTGNDLAIDMVMYGSDYLLGLSTFAPDMFGLRDQYWLKGDARFYELNDVLQYLGFFAFRAPVPAYKHSAAMFLKLRDWIATDQTHPQSPTRPDSDRGVLQGILEQLVAQSALFVN
jgi:dihydrodipicolinate synthase/N-acetylneuraminate lyase